MMQKMPLRHRRHVWPWVLGLSIVLVGAYLLWFGGNVGSELLVAAMSALLGTAFFFHRGHGDDARFMKELFEHFNKRYDDLNDELQKVLDAPAAPLEDHEKMILIDYFNLCAEEWVFRQAGYIYDPVWESWENGMRQYAANEYVAALWRQERATSSYYGFEFPLDSTT